MNSGVSSIPLPVRTINLPPFSAPVFEPISALNLFTSSIEENYFGLIIISD
jgi:hypothetical protein